MTIHNTRFSRLQYAIALGLLGFPAFVAGVYDLVWLHRWDGVWLMLFGAFFASGAYFYGSDAPLSADSEVIVYTPPWGKPREIRKVDIDRIVHVGSWPRGGTFNFLRSDGRSLITVDAISPEVIWKRSQGTSVSPSAGTPAVSDPRLRLDLPPVSLGKVGVAFG